MGDIGRLLIGLGILLALAGGALLLAERLGVPRLPGDIVVHRGPVTLVFPIVTCVVISVVLTLLLNLFLRRA
ncbi:MAG: DUF2905 domain-containing protein [Pseudomonadota bacterium]|nr:DUF2905 domain-containing protein [Pseudomonadota bacterium]